MTNPFFQTNIFYLESLLGHSKKEIFVKFLENSNTCENIVHFVRYNLSLKFVYFFHVDLNQIHHSLSYRK